MKASEAQKAKIQQFIADIDGAGIYGVHVIGGAAFANSLNARESRSGLIPFGEGKGREILAYGLDDLGNVTALNRRGYVQQFFG